jgi:phenylacetate-coenzyme A ligase PaaK-like adenylate-forming protein
MASIRQIIRGAGKQLTRFVDPAFVHGPVYRQLRRSLQAEGFSTELELESFERSQLAQLFARISTETAFFRDNSIFPENWRRKDPREVLLDLPLISKEMMQEDVHRFTLDTVPEKELEYVTTGGSTALPFGFYDRVRTSRAIETAFIHHLWSQHGFSSVSKSAVIRGAVVTTEKHPRLWRYEPFQRALNISSYHLQGAEIEEIYRKLEKSKLLYLQAYPSAANILAAYIEETSQAPLPHLRAIFLGSETLPFWQRQRIERAFSAPVYSWYGHAEKAALAGEALGSSHLHVLPRYGYVYLRGDDGSLITGPGVAGEIIATGFTNQATQFVNYRTGDIGVWAEKDLALMNNRFTRTLERVEGRQQELAITASGRKISMCAINMHSNIFDAVKQFRFVQNKRGEIRMEIVRKREYTAVNEAEIKTGVGEKFGSDMALELRYVDSIPRTKSGKARFLLQNLDLSEVENTSK